MNAASSQPNCNQRTAPLRLLSYACALVLALASALLWGCSFEDHSTNVGFSTEYAQDLGAPDFTGYEDVRSSFEDYSSLDWLGRCGPATACLGQDTMPTKEREQISSIKPTGWQRAEYDFIDGGLLYNRCHLIAYSLAAEDLNDRNLITGTRQMNLAMTQFENQVARYIDTTGNHVLYRVTPVFEERELVARGVQMEALSVEDGGRGISFNVFIPNEQDGVEIDYATGANRLSGEAVGSGSESGSSTAAVQDVEASYILNTRSMRFHLPTCDSVPTIGANNKQASTQTRDELIAAGYKPCGSCKP
ncbi:MAG: DNA/RNA non-specific endonuclease [Coriobacteriales bacterium]